MSVLLGLSGPGGCTRADTSDNLSVLSGQPVSGLPDSGHGRLSPVGGALVRGAVRDRKAKRSNAACPRIHVVDGSLVDPLLRHPSWVRFVCVGGLR